MIRLKQFYPLLNRSAVVTLKDHTGTTVFFEGMVRDIPDRFDGCAVEEFQVPCGENVTFRIMPEPGFTGTDKGLWHEGSLRMNGSHFHYWMKQYPEGSEFGIDGGRISKLMIKRDGEIVCNFDRGWDVKPTDPDAQLALDILLHTENY